MIMIENKQNQDTDNKLDMKQRKLQLIRKQLKQSNFAQKSKLNQVLQQKNYDDNSLKTIFFKKYDIKEKIGEGTTAVVKNCEIKSDSPNLLDPQFNLVVKIMKYKDVEYYFELLKEVIVLQQLRHPNIARYIDSYVDKISKTVYIVQEKAMGETLTHYQQQHKILSESQAMLIMKGIYDVILYLDSKRICHRDLSLDNILYDEKENVIKIIDFSISKELKNSTVKMWTQTGKLHYMAPEIFQLNYDQKIDIWASGVILFTLLVGYFPFSSINTDFLEEQPKKIKKKSSHYLCQSFSTIDAMQNEEQQKHLLEDEFITYGEDDDNEDEDEDEEEQEQEEQNRQQTQNKKKIMQ